MKKLLFTLAAIALPAMLEAQLGGLVNLPKLNTADVDKFITEVDTFEIQVDSATDLLYTATEEFFNAVDSFKTLPSLEKTWNTVKTDLKSAATDELKAAAQAKYVNYVKNITSRKDKFGEYWQSSDIRAQLVGYLAERKDMLMSVKDSLERAKEIDEKAIERYDEIYNAGKAAVEDLVSQIAAKPLAAASAKPVLDKGKEALASIAKIKKDAEEHIALTKYIIEKIKEMFS